MSGLVKAKKYDIEDSNIALLGSDLEKNVRLNAAQGEPAWNAAGKEVGIQIWRIEQFKVVAWPKDQYGSFYSGDSYICLWTYKKKPDDEKLSFNVHFWLGKETSQDEAGTAAYKTVELDDYLGTTPVQYREVQGHESDLFLGYFKKFQVMNGGVASGFKNVKPEEYRHRLMHVKGAKKCVVVSEVEKNVTSLNSGDVFILDCGLTLWQFNGKDSNGMERVKAAELVQAIETERKGKVTTHVVSEGDADMNKFFDALGSKGPIKSAAEGGPDTAAKSVKKLMRLSDASGKLEFTEVASGTVKKAQFDTNDVFVFDAGNTVFVWLGKKATAQEKKLGLQYAQDYLHKYKRPAFTPIARVMEGGENSVFVDALDK